MFKKNQILGAEHCRRTMYQNAPKGTNEKQWGILKIDVLQPELQDWQHQLFKLRTGFGCNPHANGNAIFGNYYADGKGRRFERYDFVGIANNEIQKWANENWGGITK